jgi:colanic acid/amylovoran biosynthesis glycosyltransferase
VSAQPVEVITVARLVEKKGIEYAIRAAALVLRDRSFRYTIVGDGPERQRLEGLIDHLGVSGSVRIIGWRGHDEVHRLLSTADAFMLPSVTAADGDEEGLPVALMEAMAAGLPVLSTLHSGIPELVRDGIEGFLVRERDVEALASRCSVLVDDPRLRAELGSAARLRIEERHDNHMLHDRLVELYRELLGEGAALTSADSTVRDVHR